MTVNEVTPYADMITSTNQRTVLFFHDSDDINGIVGYFDNNHNFDLRKKNEWNFVRTPLIDNEVKFTMIKGDDIKRISIITI